MEGTPVDQLIVVVDATDAWVGDAADGGATAPPSSAGSSGPRAHPLPFPAFLMHLRLFLAAYCAQGRRQYLAVLAYNGSVGGFVYPPPHLPGAASPLAPAHLRAAEVTATVADALASLAAAPPGPIAALPQVSPAFANLPAALTQAVCHYAAVAKAQPRLRSRILAVKRHRDVAGEYVALVNTIFSLQRFRVPLDTLQIPDAPAAPLRPYEPGASTSEVPLYTPDGDSVFFQQASHFTEGVHLCPAAPLLTALSSTMISLFLPPPTLRPHLALPARTGVDLRATCFCHARHVSHAHVCPVCLAVWCDPFAECGMCGSGARPPGGGGGGGGGGGAIAHAGAVAPG
jgi:transcription initiation factor TFIIH subunit 3